MSTTVIPFGCYFSRLPFQGVLLAVSLLAVAESCWRNC